MSNDPLDRDPQLASLLAAAGSELPPAALDAAILAAARREVSARPQAAGGGGASDMTAPRARRNWYVPVSIAAVLVLSVSLVTLVHEEKGDELAQAPAVAGAPPAQSAPAMQAPAAPATRADAPAPDAAPAQTKAAKEQTTSATQAAPAADVAGKLAKQPAVEPRHPIDSAKVLDRPRSEPPAMAPPRQQAASEPVLPSAAPGAPGDGYSTGAPPMAPATPARQRRAEPFPGATEREASPAAIPSAPAGAPAPAAPLGQGNRDAAEMRARNEADRSVARGTLQEAPAARAFAPPPPRPSEDTQAKSAPFLADGQPAAPAKPAARPPDMQAAKPALRLGTTRAPLWLGLENQLPEKWLERMAEFKRDGRLTDADALLEEFRRRFPDHPSSAR